VNLGGESTVGRQVLNIVLALVCLFVAGSVAAGRLRDRHPSYQALVGIGAGGVGVRRALMFAVEERDRRRRKRDASDSSGPVA
jgi:hypothetical protein